MKKIKFFLLPLSLLAVMASCSSDDDDTPSVSKETEMKERIVGRWYQSSGATFNGKDAYVKLHFLEDGTGHLVFITKDTKQEREVSYERLNYSIREDKITVSGSNSFSGTFEIDHLYSSSLSLVDEGKNEKYTFYKDSESKLLNYNWRLYLTESTIHQYDILDFRENGRGVMTYVGSKSTDTHEYPFSYTFDYERGPLTLQYDDGSNKHFFYSTFESINLFLFENTSEGVKYYSLRGRSK